MTDQADTLVGRLAPYRQTPGISAAILISRDGFVVAADAEPGFDRDAFAVQASSVIESTARLAGELDEHAAKYIAVEFEKATMVLAPFGEDLVLALVGAPSALACEYKLAKPTS